MNRRRVRASVRSATARASRRLCSADRRQFHLQPIVILARTGRGSDRRAIGAARLVDAIERDQGVAFELLRRHALVFHLDLGERERSERRVRSVALLLDETGTAIQCGRLVAAPHIIQHLFILTCRHLGLRRLVIRPHAPADDDARADHDAQQDRLAVRAPPPLDRLDLFLIRCVTFHGLSSLCSLKKTTRPHSTRRLIDSQAGRASTRLTPPTARAQYPPPRIPTRPRAAFAKARCAAAHRRAATSHRPTAPPPRYRPRSRRTRRRSCPRVSSGP